MSTDLESDWSAEQWFQAIGELTVRFEHAKQSAQAFLLDDLQEGDGSPTVEAKIAAVVQYLPANALGPVIASALKRTARTDPRDHALLAQFNKLGERRNAIVHCAWTIKRGNQLEALILHKPKHDEPHGVTTLRRNDLEVAIQEAIAVERGFEEMHKRWRSERAPSPTIL